MEVCEENPPNDQIKENIDQCDETNKYLSIRPVEINNNEDNQKELSSYDYLYQYGNKQIKLQYFSSHEIWNILPDQFSFEEEEKYQILLDNLHLTTDIPFDQQIGMIVQKFDQYFCELNEQAKQTMIHSIFQEDDEEIQTFTYRSNDSSMKNNVSTPSTIFEVDEEQTDLPMRSLSNHFEQKLNSCLTSGTISHRIRQDSACSSINSMKHVEFLPPSTTSVRRRRVIQSILLRVQRKKIVFEKVLNTLKHIPSEPTMYELGLEFLRIYDGKFNYPQEYTFVMLFKKRTWFLTIENIKCVECQLGESEPRSVLILNYKNKLTNVQV